MYVRLFEESRANEILNVNGAAPLRTPSGNLTITDLTLLSFFRLADDPIR